MPQNDDTPVYPDGDPSCRERDRCWAPGRNPNYRCVGVDSCPNGAPILATALARAVDELTKRFWWSARQQDVGSRIIADEYAGQDAAAGKLIQAAHEAAETLRFLDHYGKGAELEGLANRLEAAMKGTT